MALKGSKRQCKYCGGTIILGKGIYEGITWHEKPVCKTFRQLIIDAHDLLKAVKEKAK